MVPAIPVGMTKCLPVLVVTLLGCQAEPELVEVAVSDLPQPALRITRELHDDDESASIWFIQDSTLGPCHRVPAATRLTANGRDFVMKSPGGTSSTTTSTGIRWSCTVPWFMGAPLPDEPRTEFILSDGRGSRRAVFQSLRAPRSFRIKSPEHATARPGQELELEWSPATDQIDGVGFSLRQEDGTILSYQQTRRSEGNRLFITFNPTAAGHYRVTATGFAHAGEESCEDFRGCEAVIDLPYAQPLSVPLILEAP
ncbi:hypothetical protein [Cystobacter fuscus]|uniref:hypothetical protein n=1 Tax=Cystobacter fuscus TaxID=43 RepID=UPI002B2BD8A8|nr:hypothetical protein F0U63_27945 [Cystobacter fuscus]